MSPWMRRCLSSGLRFYPVEFQQHAFQLRVVVVAGCEGSLSAAPGNFFALSWMIEVVARFFRALFDGREENGFPVFCEGGAMTGRTQGQEKGAAGCDLECFMGY